jgi:hypothetical protein
MLAEDVTRAKHALGRLLAYFEMTPPLGDVTVSTNGEAGERIVVLVIYRGNSLIPFFQISTWSVVRRMPTA